MGTKTVPARPSELIILAINNLEEKDGSSTHDIVKFISKEFHMKPEEVAPRVQEALKRAINYGIISQVNNKYKIQDIPKQSTAKDGKEGASSETGKEDTQTVQTKGKKKAIKKPMSRKRKQPSKSRKNSKKVCKRCQSRRKYTDQ